MNAVDPQGLAWYEPNARGRAVLRWFSDRGRDAGRALNWLVEAPWKHVIRPLCVDVKMREDAVTFRNANPDNPAAWALRRRGHEIGDFLDNQGVAITNTLAMGALQLPLSRAPNCTMGTGRSLNLLRGFHRHHPIPKFLGGKSKQLLGVIRADIHREFHRILAERLKAAGMHLPIGGRTGRSRDWAAFFAGNPGEQQRALGAVLDTSRDIDRMYGTDLTQRVWRNLMGGNYRPIP